MMAMTEKPMLRGQLRHDEPMTRHCSWRTGGPVARFFQPADLAELQQFLAQCPPAEPLLWVGLGSNLLVRDGGFAGTVICIAGILDACRYLDESTMRAEAGLACARIARLNADNGYTGTEFLAGIPGTLGGALAMNAGAFGGETWDLVTGIETIDRRGELHTRSPSCFTVAYRSVSGPADEWFIAARLRLIADPERGGRARIRSLLARRQASQPIGEPSCGSVFRNPPEDHAARLIEAAGLKGQRLGGAQVSLRHANFIINTGDATAADIENLIDLVRERVRHHSGIELIPECRIVGTHGKPQP